MTYLLEVLRYLLVTYPPERCMTFDPFDLI